MDVERCDRRMGGPPMPRTTVSFGSTFSFPQRKGGRGLFEQNKAVAGTLEYRPYGENYTSPAPAGLTHRFTGLDLDATTGQYYAPYRYYAPNLSRWLTRDPLGMHDGTNMFAYVRYAPIAYADPMGLFLGPVYFLLFLLLAIAIFAVFVIVAALCKVFPGQTCCDLVCGIAVGIVCALLLGPIGGTICAILNGIGCLVLCAWLYGSPSPPSEPEYGC